jgi:hypothetical protein
MLYANKEILIATKHQKQRVIGPIIKDSLHSDWRVIEFDTDKFGTFTGEIPRTQNAKDTCIIKAITASQELNYPYVIASEGSFGAHPQIPFLPIQQEIMVFHDAIRDLTIVEQEMTTNTNYQTLLIESSTKLDDFLKMAKFPSHALCLQTFDQKLVIAKGIKNFSKLHQYLEFGYTIAPQLLLSTDMRAMMNPSRMHQIRNLCKKLVQRILTSCPSCQLPGFGLVGYDGNLLCQACQQPSSWHAYEVLACVKCEYQLRKNRSDKQTFIPEQYCQFCNP